MNMAVSIPCFIEEEVAQFDATLTDAIASNRPVLLARCANLSARADEIEAFAAAYLLTNVLLMERINRHILKMIYIEESNPQMLQPVLNALRATFDSSFSSLERVELWKAIVSDRTTISEQSLAEIQNTIAFVEGSGMMERSNFLRRADIFFGVHNGGARAQSPYTISEGEGGRAIISSKSQQLDIATPEYSTTGQSTSVQIENERTVAVVDVNVASEAWLESWMENIGNISAGELDAGGDT